MRDINKVKTSRGDVYNVPLRERETNISFYDDQIPRFCIDTANQSLYEFYMDYAQRHPDIVKVIRDRENWTPCFEVSDSKLLKGSFKLREPMSPQERMRRTQHLRKPDSVLTEASEMGDISDDDSTT